jgi:hypothetical protein
MRLGEIGSLTRADFQSIVREGSDQPIPACIVTNTKNGRTHAHVADETLNNGAVETAEITASEVWARKSEKRKLRKTV